MVLHQLDGFSLVKSWTTCGNDSIIEAWIVIAPIPLHSLAKLGERLPNHLELSLVVVLAPVTLQE